MKAITLALMAAVVMSSSMVMAAGRTVASKDLKMVQESGSVSTLSHSHHRGHGYHGYHGHHGYHRHGGHRW